MSWANLWMITQTEGWLPHKCSQQWLISAYRQPILQSGGAALCIYWLLCLMRLVYYCCGIMIRSDRFPPLCSGRQIDYVTQTWDDGVADASRSAKILVNGCYLPHLVSLQTHIHTHTVSEDLLGQFFCNLIWLNDEWPIPKTHFLFKLHRQNYKCYVSVKKKKLQHNRKKKSFILECFVIFWEFFSVSVHIWKISSWANGSLIRQTIVWQLGENT